jgi:cbb3-type cytochrome oxidase subunit 1
MKFIVSVLLTMLLSFAVGLFGVLPWWSFAICAFIVALIIHQKAWKAFLSGFLSLAMLWGLMAAYIDIQNEHLLGNKVANVLLKTENSLLLILITAIVGGLVAGFAAMTGSYLRKR